MIYLKNSTEEQEIFIPINQKPLISLPDDEFSPYEDECKIIRKHND